MSADLFARAKGPRREIDTLGTIPCPWCGRNCWDDITEHDSAAAACEGCGKEFMWPDERGELVCVGLLSPADMKYLAAKEKPHVE